MIVFINPLRLLYMCFISISPEMMSRPIIWTNTPTPDTTARIEMIDTPLIQSIYIQEKEQGHDIVPAYHPYSRYHYEHLYMPRYGTVMSYADYCRLEQALSMMLLGIEEDAVVVFNDPWWMDDESLVSYWTMGERHHIDRRLRIDLDRTEKLSVFPVINQQDDNGEWKRSIPDIVWNQHLQPRL